jgi:hypothetical protein
MSKNYISLAIAHVEKDSMKGFWFYVYFTDSKKFQAFYLQKFQIEEADQAFYTLRNYFLYVCIKLVYRMPTTYWLGSIFKA